MSCEEIKVGCSGGILLPTLFQPSISKATTKKFIDEDSFSNPYQLPKQSAWLPNPAQLNPKWSGIAERSKAVKPEVVIKDSIQLLQSCPDINVPLEILESVMLEVLDPEALLREANLAGNRVAVCVLAHASPSIAAPRSQPSAEAPDVPTSREREGGGEPSEHNRHVLMIRTSGSVCQTLELYELCGSGPETACIHMQCKSLNQQPLKNHTILQVLLNRNSLYDSGASKAQLLLAVRCSAWIIVLIVAKDKTGQWNMETIAEVSLTEQPMQMAWNRLIPTELAYALADSSVSLLNVAHCLKTAPFTPGRVAASVQLILEQQQLAPYWVPSQRLSIDFGPHPRTIMLAAGTKLLRTTIGKPGQLCGQFTLLHQLPEGEFFTAIAIPCKFEQDDDKRHLSAACTTKHMLLLDLRRTADARLRWSHPHGIFSGPPTVIDLAFQPPGATTSQSAAPDTLPAPLAHAPSSGGSAGTRVDGGRGAGATQQRHPSANGRTAGPAPPPAAAVTTSEPLIKRGIITACSLVTGDAVTFSFIIMGGGEQVMLEAYSAPLDAPNRTRRAGPAAGFPGRIEYQAGPRDSGIPAGGSASNYSVTTPAFRWSPLLSTVHRGALPKRLCAPLTLNSGPPTALLKLHKDLLHADFNEFADLQGFAIARWHSSSAENGDMSVIRINVVGDVIIEDGRLFGTPPPGVKPDSSAAPVPQTLHLIRIPAKATEAMTSPARAQPDSTGGGNPCSSEGVRESCKPSGRDEPSAAEEASESARQRAKRADRHQIPTSQRATRSSTAAARAGKDGGGDAVGIDGSSPTLQGSAAHTGAAGECGSEREPDDSRTTVPTAAELADRWRMKKLEAESRTIEMKILADPTIQIRLPDGSSRGCLIKTWNLAQSILREEFKRDARASSSLPSHSPSSAHGLPHVPTHVSPAAAASAEEGANPAQPAGRPASAGTGLASATTGLKRKFGWDDSISTPCPSEDTLAAGVRLGGQNGLRTVPGLSDEERAAATEILDGARIPLMLADLQLRVRSKLQVVASRHAHFVSSAKRCRRYKVWLEGLSMGRPVVEPELKQDRTAFHWSRFAISLLTDDRRHEGGDQESASTSTCSLEALEAFVMEYEAGGGNIRVDTEMRMPAGYPFELFKSTPVDKLSGRNVLLIPLEALVEEEEEVRDSAAGRTPRTAEGKAPRELFISMKAYDFEGVQGVQLEALNSMKAAEKLRAERSHPLVPDVIPAPQSQSSVPQPTPAGPSANPAEARNHSKAKRQKVKRREESKPGR